jgi:hypothetical protein
VGGVVGKWLGPGVGAGVIGVGKEDGGTVGWGVGDGVGSNVGVEDGGTVGWGVGDGVGSNVGVGVGMTVGAVVSIDAEAAFTPAMLETPISVANDTKTESSVPTEMAVVTSAVTLLNTSSSCCTRCKDRKEDREKEHVRERKLTITWWRSDIDTCASSTDISKLIVESVDSSPRRPSVLPEQECAPKLAMFTPEITYVRALFITFSSAAP